MTQQNEILQIPADISKVETMSNRSLRIRVDTQEGLTDVMAAKVMAFHEKRGWFSFSPETRKLKPEDIVSLPKLPTTEEEEKTPSQRLRARMFVYYKETHTKEEGFENWYRETLDKIGQKYLDKMNA